MSDLKVNAATIEFVRQEQARRRKGRAVASIAGLVLVAAISTAGYFGWQRYQDGARRDAARALVAQVKPGDRSSWQKMREAVDSGVVTRDQLEAAGREARDKREKEEMDGYFRTAAADRDKYLDQLIDEEQKRWAEFMKNRPTSRPTTRPEWQRDATSRPTRTNAEREAQGRARADNTSPLQRAQQSEFQAAKRARESARGIQGRGGRGGPGGGGRGGWGGGGR